VTLARITPLLGRPGQIARRGSRPTKNFNGAERPGAQLVLAAMSDGRPDQ